MPRLNWKNILYNIKDAREELERIEKIIEGKGISEIELKVALEHAYHHLNFAWNIRHVPDKRHKKMSNEDFNEWSQFPKEIEIYRLEIKDE